MLRRRRVAQKGKVMMACVGLAVAPGRALEVLLLFFPVA